MGKLGIPSRQIDVCLQYKSGHKCITLHATNTAAKHTCMNLILYMHTCIYMYIHVFVGSS